MVEGGREEECGCCLCSGFFGSVDEKGVDGKSSCSCSRCVSQRVYLLMSVGVRCPVLFLSSGEACCKVAFVIIHLSFSLSLFFTSFLYNRCLDSVGLILVVVYRKVSM